MTFVSYAQNFEDVMLWRAFRHIGQGRYIDIGAQHPVVDSVSKAFYDAGWRGIHIEPVPYYADLLRKHRPDETVLELAISDADGTIELNVIDDTGLSTAVSSYAEQHQKERSFGLRRITVDMRTLASAIPDAGGPVHWLKIDVEGLEEQVLKGWDSNSLRPWVMIVEATLPGSPEAVYGNWEYLLVDAGYRFVYFDGLNRYYVAAEHEQLADAFTVPPNVFDDILLTENSSLCNLVLAACREKEAEIAAACERRISDAESRASAYAAALEDARRENEEMRNSVQWKVYERLRKTGDKLARLFRPGKPQVPDATGKPPEPAANDDERKRLSETLSPHAAKIFSSLCDRTGYGRDGGQEGMP